MGVSKISFIRLSVRLVSPHACPLPKVLHVCDRNDRIEDLVVTDSVHVDGHRIAGQDLRGDEESLATLDITRVKNDS